MTIITFDQPVKLPRTHFRDLEDFFVVAKVIPIKTSIKHKDPSKHPFLQGVKGNYTTDEKILKQDRYNYLAGKHLS